MSHVWIMDVLHDLHDFAAANDLPRLAAHLQEAQRIAVDESAGQAASAVQGTVRKATTFRRG